MISNVFSRLGKVHQMLWPQDKSTTLVVPSGGGNIATERYTAEQIEQATAALTETLTEDLTFPVVEGTEDSGTIIGRPYIFKNTSSRTFTFRYNDSIEGIHVMELHPLEA